MDIGFIILVIFIWHIVGVIICVLWGVGEGTDGWELCNPYWYHEYHFVNWFGAVVGSMFYSILCPLGAITYWFYKLCTVGRE